MTELKKRMAVACRKVIGTFGFCTSLLIFALALYYYAIVQPTETEIPFDLRTNALVLASLAIGPYILSALLLLNLELQFFELSESAEARPYRAAVLFATFATTASVAHNLRDFAQILIQNFV